MWNKRLIILTIVLILLVNFLFASSIPAFAHTEPLAVVYDPCVVDSNNSDGIDEMWYILDNGASSYHLSHETDTITYYFEENGSNGCTWTTGDISEAEAEEIKTAYANSMKKWNNVYFYSHNSDGTITKNKIINVVEGTAETANLKIYPGTGSVFASTMIDPQYGSSRTIHFHAPAWKMIVNVNQFHSSNTVSEIAVAKERTGSHELGHVLGLFDIDEGNACDANHYDWHHHEVLMGYGEPIESRNINITYKDIAGVAITRGFHTDDDHDWLYTWEPGTSNYKLICSICNGVKYVESSEAYQHMPYGCCDEDHTLSGGNMMAVASYENQDYYKCRFCRYVAPFSDIVTQSYTKTTFSDELHKCVSTVNGLTYTFYEEHTLDDTMCTGCGYVHTHTYGPYLYHNARSHAKVCNCGKTETEGHWVYAADIIDGRYATCQVCNYLLDLNEDLPTIINSIHQVSVNGSYILPNGIVVLVEEDVEAYLAGTLQFYHPEDVPVTQ